MFVSQEGWQKSEGRDRDSLPLRLIKRPFTRLQFPPGRILDIPGGAGNTTRLLRFAFRCLDGSLRIYRLRVRGNHLIFGLIRRP
jgi:hypothetical protein